MKKYILTFVAVFAGLTSLFADDYNIKVQVDGISNDKAILAYYFSSTKYIRDTVEFDENGLGIINDTEEIPGGIYLLAFPQLKLRYFELILGDEKEFSLHTDTSDLVLNMEVKNSLENDLFYKNLKYMMAAGQSSSQLKEKIKTLEEGSEAYEKERSTLVKLDQDVNNFRRAIVAEHPETFYANILGAMMDVDLPENPNPKDSSYAYHFYQKHYFDNIDLTDSRLSRTPILLNKITRFLDYYTLPYPDSINTAVDNILEMAEPNYEMFQFCLQSIFNKYAKSNVMAHELVYVYLAKKYYANPEIVDWVDEEQRTKIIDVVRKKTPTLLGTVAPEIIIEDISGNVQKLHEVAGANDFTILVFWNSGCGHCKTDMPILRDLYETELKQLGNIDIFAVTTELEYDEWTKFINDNELKKDGWIHCIDVNASNFFRVVYDVTSTPIVIILDKNKEILAKRINIEDVKGLIEFNMNDYKIRDVENSSEEP